MGRDIRAHRKELHTKKDIHGEDIETGEDVIDLLRRRSYGGNVQSK